MRVSKRAIFCGIISGFLMGLPSGYAEVCTHKEGAFKADIGGGQFRIKRSIPVQLFAAGSDTTWNGMPIQEVEANIKAAIDTYLEEGGADVRMYWAGRTTSADATGKILVRRSPSECVCAPWQACAAPTFDESGDHRIGSTLWFDRFPNCFTIRNWVSDPIEDGIMGFRNVLLHEMGHALGLNHPESCVLGAFRYSVMYFHDYNELQRDDIESLVSLYGLQCRRVEPYESTFMLAWFPGDASASCIRYPARGGGPAFQDTAILGTLGFFTVRAGRSVDDSEGFLEHEFPDLTDSGLTMQATAAARGPTPEDQILVWTHGEDNAVGPEAFTRLATTRDGGETWTVRGGGGPGRSENPPTVTYDPKSGFYLVFWDHYATYTLDGDLVHYGLGSGETPESIHTPVAACREASAVNNCLVAWDRVHAFGCLAFMHTGISNTGRLVTGVIRTDCYTLERSPSVLHRAVDPTKPWGLALKQRELIFSFVKEQTGATWTHERVVVYDPVHGVFSPSLTLVGDGSEWQYRVYTGRRH